MTVRCACCAARGEGDPRALEHQGWRAEKAKGITAWYCPLHAELVREGKR